MTKGSKSNEPAGLGTPDFFSQLLDAAPDAMVVVDDQSRICLINLQAEQLFGYTRDELIGQPLGILIPERFRRVHPEHVGEFFSSPRKRSMGSGLELAGRRKDGTELPIEVSLSPLMTKQGMTVSAAIRDISDRKKLEASTKLLMDRLTAAVESIHDAFALFDDKDHLVLCNSVYRGILGEVTGPVVGRSYEDLLASWVNEIQFPDEGARERFKEERLTHRRDATTTFDIRTKDGRTLRVIDRRTPEGGVVKTIWDLTEDQHLAERLTEARAAAETANTAKSEFLSSMSHELRTPLNAILGFAQLLQRDKKEPLTNRHKDRVTHILNGGEHLLRLIDDILDLSRIESGTVSISAEPVSVFEVLAEVKQTLGPIASRHGVHIDLEESSELPMVIADRRRFSQILMNFGSNAIKYNQPNGKATFSVSRSAERLRITVRDTGIGIPLDQQDKLFQPFQRAGQETGTIEGTGIGLVITKRLAEMMAGETGFRSVPGKGSEFWVEMPLYIDAAPPGVTPKLDAGSQRQLSPAGQKIVLYVEDNSANVTFMRDLVSTFEHVDLLSVPTAEMGIEVARKRHLDAILMDINLPGMSGIDALRTLRSLRETRDIPVIALTAAASERDRQRGEQAGFYRYLTKPVKVDEFISALEELFAREH